MTAHSRIHHHAALWIPVAIWMTVIFFLSSQSSFPHAPDQLIDLIGRKLAHFSEYALLALLVGRALASGGRSSIRVFGWTLGICLLYAASDEWHQSFVPLRTPSPVDVGIDMLGATSGATAFWWWMRHPVGPAGSGLY